MLKQLDDGWQSHKRTTERTTENGHEERRWRTATEPRNSEQGYSDYHAPLLSTATGPMSSVTLSTAKAVELFKWAIEDASETCNLKLLILINKIWSKTLIAYLRWTLIERSCWFGIGIA